MSYTRYDQKEKGLGQYNFIARDDKKLLVVPLEVFPLEAPLKLLLDASQGSCHVLFDVLNPLSPLRTPLIFGNNQ